MGSPQPQVGIVLDEEPSSPKVAITMDPEEPQKSLELPQQGFKWKPFTWAKRILFLDIDPLVRYGYRVRLEPQDMYPEQNLRTEELTALFEPALQKQKEKQAALVEELQPQLDALNAKLGPRPAVALEPQGPASQSGAAATAAAKGSRGATGGRPAPAQKPPKEKLTGEQKQRAKLESLINKNTKRIDLKRVVIGGNAKVLIGTGILYLISQACSLAGPLLLQRIVAGLACQPFKDIPGVQCESKTKLYYYCIGLFLAPAVQSLCDNHQNWLLYLTGTRMRNSLMAAIYRKCLRLSNSSLQEESVGRVVTLMSNDAQKLQDAMFAIHSMWGSPCYIIAVLILLWFQVGWATFVGLAVMATLGPLSGKVATKLGGLRRETLQWTDKRVGYMNEVISGIQMIKFYAWEVPFSDKVMGARSQEARILRTTAGWQGVFAMVLFSGPVLVAIFCFGAWTLSGHTLSSAEAYTALTLFSLLRFPMSFLPMLITMVINALVALKRIGTFLNKPESELSKEVLDMHYPTGEVLIKDGEFSWDESVTASTLRDIQLQAKPGSLTMVVGGVGSGKSSMLGALVGHMVKRKGTAKVGGKVAYVAQTAWIMNDTVQENVLLGDPEFSPERYKMALKVSQLGPDLEILPNGDQTEIGDRGITLSGGQKQRVSIARAVYSNADVYLLDDPLSAVDSHVGRALFEECINGLLKPKTIILVTNALQYLPMADHVVWMENGTIRAQGTYAQVSAAGLNIAELNMDSDSEEDESEGEKSAGESSGGKGQEDFTVGANVEAKRTSSTGPKKERRHSVQVNNKKSSVTLKRIDSTKNLTGVEEREAGNLSLDVINQYVKAGGGLPIILTLFFLYAIEQGARVYTDRWVGIWSSDQYGQTLAFYLGIYFGLGCFYGLCTFARTLRFFYTCVNAAVSLHNRLLGHLLRLPKTFFDVNPSGRILNRFSRDTDIMDATLPQSLSQTAGCFAQYISILIVISIATKWFGLGLVPLTILYFFIQRYYIPTARELQRIESISRSPIYSKFSEALSGVATIRAYRREGHFTQVSDRLMEQNACAFMTQKLAAGWLAMRLDIFGLIVVTGCGALVIQGNVNPGLAGLALMYSLDMTRFLKFGTSMASKSEADFNSVERIIQYLQPATEAAPDTAPEVAKEMPNPWPSLGTIDVVDLMLKYRPELPLVLKGISFRVEGGEKVGLVGRTGSGKSSIFLALLRMVEPTSGHVYIDGVDTRTLGVRHLRSQMSIIPQDPFMFSGTVRNNLDPFEQHNDARLWEVLEAVGLKPAISALEGGLSAKVVDNGNNFSLGQRQLFCMARAMLRSSRILMLDEATASVDVDTDAQIQNAIRTAFAACTMLTIAHRLNTIMDSDKVVVLDHGRVVEFAHPDQLLRNEVGIFTGMVNQTGKSSARYLKSLAASSAASIATGSARKPTLMTSYAGGSFLGGAFGSAPATPMLPSPAGLRPIATGPKSDRSSKSDESPTRLSPLGHPAVPLKSRLSQPTQPVHSSLPGTVEEDPAGEARAPGSPNSVSGLSPKGQPGVSSSSNTDPHTEVTHERPLVNQFINPTFLAGASDGESEAGTPQAGMKPLSAAAQALGVRAAEAAATFADVAPEATGAPSVMGVDATRAVHTTSEDVAHSKAARP